MTTTSAGRPSRRDRRFPGPPYHGAASHDVATPPPRPAVAKPDVATFADLGVAPPLVEALQAAGCRTPLPIQAATLPSALAGRDVLGRARTGSGKTVAFAVPAVMTVSASIAGRRPGAPRGLVLVPTRELAVQVANTLTFLGRAVGVRVAIVHGGVSQGPQVSALRRGVDVLVACPGRLEDLIEQRHCTLSRVEVSVLDEADHLADLGFLPSVRRLLDQTPADGQRLLFSATLDRAVDGLVARYLRNAITHSVDAVDSPPPELEHHTFAVTPGDKAVVVRELASGRERSLLFTRTKHSARKLMADLTRNGIPAVDLHGNLSQSRRDRNLAAFAEGAARVLVATDIAARGIHVDGINLVVHVDPPAEHKAYLHRSGRTARAGARGSVVTVVLPDQTREVAAMIRRAGIRATAVPVGPGAPQTAALTGPPADRVLFPSPSPSAAPRPSTGVDALSRAGRRPGPARAPHRGSPSAQRRRTR